MTRPRFAPRDRLVLSIALILIAVSLAGVGATAGNSLQGLTSVISYAFTGTQRAATNK